MTSSDIKELAPVIKEEIDKASHILLHLHQRPDPDSVGSALAMYHALRKMNKAASVIAGDGPLPEEFSVFPGRESILAKNFLEVDLAQFDLFISVDTADKIQISRQGEVNFPPHLRVIVIDHHHSNAGYGHINLVDTKRPAAAELLYELFKAWELSIDENIARCLFAGIYFDTARFTIPLVTSRTLHICAELSGHVPDFSRMLFVLDNSKTPDDLRLEAEALSSVKEYFGGLVAVSMLTHDVIERFSADPTRLRKLDIVSRLRSVKGWDIDISMTEEVNNRFKVSFRTRDESHYDVSKIAVALGGGGHKGASATVIELPFKEAMELLLRKIQETFPELGNP